MTAVYYLKKLKKISALFDFFLFNDNFKIKLHGAKPWSIVHWYLDFVNVETRDWILKWAEE